MPFEYSKTLLLPPNINTISEYMRLYGAADWQPTLPEGAAAVRLTENQLPSKPGTPKAAEKPTVTPATSKMPCKPGMTAAQCAAAGLKSIVK